MLANRAVRASHALLVAAGVAALALGAAVGTSSAATAATVGGCSRNPTIRGSHTTMGNPIILGEITGSCNARRTIIGEIKHDLTGRPDPVFVTARWVVLGSYDHSLNGCEEQDATYYTRADVDGYTDNHADSAHRRFNHCVQQ